MGTMPPVEHTPYKREDKEQEKFPEIDRQKELEKNFEYKDSINHWYYPIVVDGEMPSIDGLAKLLLAEKHELPFLMSAVLERTCNLACKHCLYGPEDSSKQLSIENNLAEVIVHMVKEMPKSSDAYDPTFMSAGRILRKWHLDILKNIHAERPDVSLGIIDNGTFTKLMHNEDDNRLGFKEYETLKFDWMNISIDGTLENHDKQRGDGAYQVAMNGLRRAREVTKSPEEGGKISSLFTLTTINAGDIKVVADMLLSHKEDEYPLADEFHITTLSPTNEINTPLQVEKEAFEVAWSKLKEASEKYPPIKKAEGGIMDRVLLKIYRVRDMEKLAEVVGEQKFMEAFSVNEDKNSPTARRNNILISIDGVNVVYFPLSIWTPEEFNVEADAKQRTAYEGTFTLEELRSKQKVVTSKGGGGEIATTVIDTTPYTIGDLDTETNFREAYEKGVDHWWKHFGREKFEEEMEAFKRIRAKATEQGWIQPKV